MSPGQRARWTSVLESQELPHVTETFSFTPASCVSWLLQFLEECSPHGLLVKFHQLCACALPRADTRTAWLCWPLPRPACGATGELALSGRCQHIPSVRASSKRDVVLEENFAVFQCHRKIQLVDVNLIILIFLQW